MEFKHIGLEWKADDSGAIEGYGAFYGNKDLGGDIVAHGAFSESLASGRKVKMLSQHDPYNVVGVWDELTEDEKGLRVKGRILTSIQAGKDAYELVKAGAIDGLSIGYKTLRTKAAQGARVIEKADIWEVSLVTFPMNEMTRIDAVKAADMSRRDIERLLTQDAGLARSVARQLMAGGYDAIKSKQDAGEGIEEIAALLKARCTL